MSGRVLWIVCAVVVALTGLAAAAFWPESCRTVPGAFVPSLGQSCDQHVVERIVVAGLGLAAAIGILALTSLPRPASHRSEPAEKIVERPRDPASTGV